MTADKRAAAACPGPERSSGLSRPPGRSGSAHAASAVSRSMALIPTLVPTAEFVREPAKVFNPSARAGDRCNASCQPRFAIDRIYGSVAFVNAYVDV